MRTSCRFAMAVHVLCVLAHAKGHRQTSPQLARSVNVHPVVIRRLLLQLQQAGLVATAKGAGAGSQLARDACRIQLAEVYRAVETDKAFAQPVRPPNPDCPVGQCIQEVLDRIFQSAQDALEQALGQTRLSDLTDCMQHRQASHKQIPLPKPRSEEAPLAHQTLV